jgi:hypothetical protein
LSETNNGEKQTTKNIGALKGGRGGMEAAAKFTITDFEDTMILKSASDYYSGILKI